MSTGPRIPLERADQLAAFLFKRWGLAEPACMVVGSVRRRKDWVGDLEIIAPLRDKGDDQEHRRIAATMAGYMPAGMFDAAPEQPIGKAIEGLKPGFKEARLLVQTRTVGEFPVQIFRYTPRNAGWITLMRTGPEDFGKWFLWKWKEHWGIPVGDESRKASDKGHLIDASGTVVDVPTEADAFRLAGMEFIPPCRRAVVMDHMNSGRREFMR